MQNIVRRLEEKNARAIRRGSWEETDAGARVIKTTREPITGGI